jgi:hypothetical protein
MRVGPLWLGFLVLLSWQSSLADAIRFRCVRAGPGSKEIMVVTLDPLLGQMKAESYTSKTLSSQMTFQIEAMDEAVIRGRNVASPSRKSSLHPASAMRRRKAFRKPWAERHEYSGRA